MRVVHNPSKKALWTLDCLFPTFHNHCPVPCKAELMLCLLLVPVLAPNFKFLLLRPCFSWHRLCICLCVISAWHKLRIAEGTCWSSIYRWTLMSLTLIAVHNQRHHFILNLAEPSIFFFGKWKRVVSPASFIRIKHMDTLKLTGINADKQGKSGMHVIYWYPRSFFFYLMCFVIMGERDEESCPLHNTIWMIEYIVLREGIKGKINDLGLQTKKKRGGGS